MNTYWELKWVRHSKVIKTAYVEILSKTWDDASIFVNRIQRKYLSDYNLTYFYNEQLDLEQWKTIEEPKQKLKC